jgi:phospholipid/cholesterol/gamma-HCH transport system substrate-binding protein
MQNNTVETIIGAIVVAIAVAFIYFAWESTSAGSLSGYEVQADLARVDGLSVGTDVRLSGVKVGTIASLSLKPNYLVNVRMRIASNIQIPTDSSLVVTSSGVLGSSYLSISPGGDVTMMKNGDKFGHAQGSVDLMGLVGRFINGGGSSGGQQPQGAQQKPPAPAQQQPPANKPPQQTQKNGPAPLPAGRGP